MIKAALSGGGCEKSIWGRSSLFVGLSSRSNNGFGFGCTLLKNRQRAGPLRIIDASDFERRCRLGHEFFLSLWLLRLDEG